MGREDVMNERKNPLYSEPSIETKKDAYAYTIGILRHLVDASLQALERGETAEAYLIRAKIALMNVSEFDERRQNKQMSGATNGN